MNPYMPKTFMVEHFWEGDNEKGGYSCKVVSFSVQLLLSHKKRNNSGMLFKATKIYEEFMATN